MGMHRVYDFVEELGALTPLEASQFVAAAEDHQHRVEDLTGTIVAVGADTFTVQDDSGAQSEWPLRGWRSDYRRGLRCHVLIGEDDVIGVGEAARLRYITLPQVTQVWVQSRGVGHESA